MEIRNEPSRPTQLPASATIQGPAPAVAPQAAPKEAALPATRSPADNYSAVKTEARDAIAPPAGQKPETSVAQAGRKSLAEKAVKTDPSASSKAAGETKAAPSKEPTDAQFEKSRAKPTQVSIKHEGGKTILNAGTGDDQIKVSQLADGRLQVTTNGESVTLSKRESKNLVICGGKGNDRIELDPNVKQGVTLDGGAGNDTLIGGQGKDVLKGGSGHDYLEGRGGDDVLKGGSGNDVLYGLDGKDTLEGGSGRDYLDGGRGDDKLRGGSGNDQLMGGAGNDALHGGSGADVLAGGSGKNRLEGGSGKDKMFHQKGDKVVSGRGDKVTEVDLSRTNAAGGVPGSSITVNGSPEFQARVQSDLEAMRSLPFGQDFLIGIDNAGKSVKINETTGGNEAGPDKRADTWLRADGTPGPGSGGHVDYNPTRMMLGGGAEDWQIRPPFIGLAHELVHVNDYVHGTLVNGKLNGTNNRELSATGLPYDRDGNGTADPNTLTYTENKFRELLNVPRRPRY